MRGSNQHAGQPNLSPTMHEPNHGPCLKAWAARRGMAQCVVESTWDARRAGTDGRRH